MATRSKPQAFLLRALFALALAVPFVATRMSTAGFSPQDLRAHVEIDGVNYGSFDKIDGLADVGAKAPSANGALAYKRVTLKRDFVTDPSLYLWAKNIMHGRSDLKDVHVVMETRDGEEVSRYVLKYSQPLSWTVEAANPALGGFHEKIDLAVQEIAVY
jgi:hypothetical protein